MEFLSIGSLSEKLGILLMLAVLPALALLLYSGIEQRQVSIETARKQVFQLTNTMAHSLDEMTNSIKNIHSTLSLFPAVQNKDAQACINIFKAVLNDNPNYKNIALVDLTGNVIASGKPYVKTNLSDRKHFREVLENKKFAVGEYIISRVGTSAPAFGFAHPVFDENGNLTAILTAIIELANYANFHSLLNLQERSFIAITDHQGIRLFYHPAQSSTNPVGKPIKARSWQMAKAAHGPGSFISKGSDGRKRLFAFEQVRLLPDETPYLYVWAGIPEANILKPANAQLTRNLILMFIVAMTSFLASRVIWKKTDALILKLEKAVKEIKILRGIIPICSHCKVIRNDKGSWVRLEQYIQDHSEAKFSHGICDVCVEKYYKEVDWKKS